MKPMSREEVALAMFTALLPQSIKKANEKLFPEGAAKVMKDEMSAAWTMADLWISERKTLMVEAGASFEELAANWEQAGFSSVASAIRQQNAIGEAPPA
jgi:hypothetical protein